MITPVRIKDIDDSFWDQNKELSLMSPFNVFKKKAKSDKIMMAVYLIYDPKSSFRKSGMNTEEIITDVNKNYLNDVNFDWDKYQDIIEAYKDKCISRIAKKLYNLLDEIDEIEVERSNLSWADDESAKLKSLMFKESVNLYGLAISLQKELEEEIEAIELESEYALSMIEGYSL